MKTLVATLAGLVLGTSLVACRIDAGFRQRRLTGTCEGACDHYLSCKRTNDAGRHQACVSECREVFQDVESLRAFESLECDAVVEYVEGESGRGPGQMVGGSER